MACGLHAARHLNRGKQAASTRQTVSVLVATGQGAKEFSSQARKAAHRSSQLVALERAQQRVDACCVAIRGRGLEQACGGGKRPWLCSFIKTLQQPGDTKKA